MAPIEMNGAHFVVNGGTAQFGDNYLSIDGTNMAVTGRVMELFLDVIQTSSHYNASSTSKRTRSIVEELKNHELKYQSSVENLLSSITSEDKIGRLKSDWKGIAWRDEDLDHKLLEYYGEEARLILETASSIHRTLSKLGKKLPPIDNAAPTKVQLDRAEKVIRSFGYGPEDKPSMERLKASISEFRKLTTDVTKSTSTRTTVPKSLRDIQLVHDCADGLYDALKGGWHCDCNELHPANIELDVWSTRKRTEDNTALLEFSFLFADDAQHALTHHWLTAEVIQSDMDGNGGRPNGTAFKNPVIDPAVFHSTSPTSEATLVDDDHDNEQITDLCRVLSDSSPVSRSARRRLGSISSTHDCRTYRLSTRFDQLTSTKSRHSFRLADALRQLPQQHRKAHGRIAVWPDMHPKHRVQLGRMLAWGVLQISSTGWLDGYWTRDNILLVMDSDDKPRPFVIHRFESSRRHSEPHTTSTLNPEVSTSYASWTGSDALFALGVFLIEMCFGQRIEDLANEEEKPHAHTTMFTALRLEKEIGNHLGTWYQDAVHGCLHCVSKIETDKMGKPIDSIAFARYVLSEVIRPLEDAANIFEK